MASEIFLRRTDWERAAMNPRKFCPEKEELNVLMSSRDVIFFVGSWNRWVSGNRVGTDWGCGTGERRIAVLELLGALMAGERIGR